MALKKTFSCWFVLLLLVLTGCGGGGTPTAEQSFGPPALDCSSKEAYEKSIGTMNTNLSDEEKARLGGALSILAKVKQVQGGYTGPSAYSAMSEYSGMTAEQLIAAGDEAAKGGAK